ncbi:hypothetical protein [Bosea sp. TAF32]|uniref:hypothetical protein n=1 Tax=Bosea sp. TAF32 TaxID=3237482 RepID=UPI003F917183
MTDGDSDPGRLDERAAAILRAELARVLASDAFRAAPQLSAFLSFIVERTIEGRAAELKGYTIAVEGLGRPADFNPQIDPIVRVEAGRLRRALTQYYAGEGQGDPVVVSMPVGGYVPVFEVVDPDTEMTWEQTSVLALRDDPPVTEALPVAKAADRVATRRWSIVTAAALALGLLTLAWWYLAPADTPAGLSSAKLNGNEQVAGAQPAITAPLQLVRVAITIPVVPSDPKLAGILHRFSDLLVDAMARFDDLVTIKAPPPGTAAPADVDYVFEMNVQAVDSGVEGLGRLRSVRDGRIVWTASSGRPSLELLQDSELAEMARNLATRLTEPFGIIPADIRQSQSLSAVRCILQAFDARRTMVPEDHLAARSCLERLIEQDPSFYPAWAHLAIMTLGEYGSGFNPDDLVPKAGEQKDKPPLDRALAAALTAIRLAPSGARAYQAMMKVLFLRGSTEEALQKGRDALTRNPYDPDIMADLGAFYVRRGRSIEGLPILERAAALSVGRPPRYDFYAFLGAYLIGAKKVSETYAAMLAADTSPFGLLAQALSAASEDDAAAQAKAIAQLRDKAPLFKKDPHAYLARKGFADEVASQVLAPLGLDKS